MIAALLLAATTPGPVRLYGCRMGGCWWYKETTTTSVLRNRDGELLRSVTLEGSSRHPDDNYPDSYSPRLHVRFKEKTKYVFCSRSRPSIAFFTSDGPDGRQWLGHMLDLFDLHGYNSWSAVTYLRACHGLDSPRRETVLRRLGYHRGTPSTQIKLHKPSDLANGAFVTRAIKAAEEL
jgi:hypothetical protein